MKFRVIGITLISILLVSKPVIAQVPPVPQESESWVCDAIIGYPTNTELFVFWDHNGDYHTQIGDNLIAAKGEVRYGNPEEVIHWDTMDPIACMTLPYGVEFTIIVTESVNFNCLTPVTQTMVDSGLVTYELPCQRVSTIEWLYNLWIGLVSN